MFEGAVLGGVLYYYLDLGAKTESMLVFVTMVGSLCVSYVRARAEVEGVSLYDGIFTRVVRLLFLTAGLVSHRPPRARPLAPRRRHRSHGLPPPLRHLAQTQGHPTGRTPMIAVRSGLQRGGPRTPPISRWFP